MWAIFSIFGFLFYIVYEILAKKEITNGSKSTPYSIRLCIYLMGLLGVVIVWIGNFGESGLSPIELSLRNPYYIFAVLLNVIGEILYLVSLRYIGISAQNAVYGINGIFLFFGLMFVNLVLGKLSDVKSMFTLVKFIPIVILVVSIALLPNIELICKKKNNFNNDKDIKVNDSRKNMVIGIFIVLLAVIIDTIALILGMIVIDDNAFGTIDYLVCGYTITSIFIPIIYLLFRKSDSGVRLLSKKTFSHFFIGIFYLGYAIFYSMSMVSAPVKSGIMWIVYPVFPVIASKIFLKEKYTYKQWACIILAILSAIAFGVVDAIM